MPVVVRIVVLATVAITAALLFLTYNGDTAVNDDGPLVGWIRAGRQLTKTQPIGDSHSEDLAAIDPYADTHQAGQDETPMHIHHRRLSEQSIESITKTFKPPLHVGGSWIGNRWFPDADYYKLYSASEMRSLYRGKNILFIGDATARRAYAGLYSILNSTSASINLYDIDDPKVIDINSKNKHKQEQCERDDTLLFCRHFGGAMMDMRLQNCPHRVDTSSWETKFAAYDLIVVSIGVWELNYSCNHNMQRNKNSPQNKDKTARAQRFVQLLEDLAQVQRDDLMIVYRTSGNMGNTPEDSLQNQHTGYDGIRLNKLIRTTVDRLTSSYLEEHDQLPSLSYLDYGSVVVPSRSSPQAVRLQGPTPETYAWQARIAFFQMLTNHIVERQDQVTKLAAAKVKA